MGFCDCVLKNDSVEMKYFNEWPCHSWNHLPLGVVKVETCGGV